MVQSLIADVLHVKHEKRNQAGKPYSEYLKIVNEQSTVLRKFQPALSSNEIEKLSADTFRRFLNFSENQHWTGLHRSGSKICADMEKLRSALKLLFDETVPIADRLDRWPIPGASVGILTPLLLVRYPAKYGVWNTKAENAMKLLRIWPKFPRGLSRGNRFRLVNDILVGLSKETGFDLWTIDGLWHVINEESKLQLDQHFKDEEEEQRKYFESGGKESTVFRYERNAKARAACIKKHGTKCKVCRFDFFKTFGELGLGFIHVHHVEDRASRSVEEIDPEKDLVPVCPNCHAMLHCQSKPARSVKQLKEIIAATKRQRILAADASIPNLPKNRSSRSRRK